MKKRILSAVLASALLIGAHSAMGAEFKELENLHAVPASVYQEPFMDSRFTTQYAPWYKMWHPMTQSEFEQGKSGADAHQQIRALAISPADPDIMYFGTDTSGIWKSENGGENWFNTNNGYRGSATYDIVCDPFDRDTVYVSGQKNGFARSTDGGKSWVEILADSDDMYAYKSGTMEIDAAGNLFMAAFSGIYKLDKAKQTVTNLTPQFASLNTDNGMDFRHIDVSEDGMHIYVAAVTNSKNLETAVSGLYTSHDGGATWTNRGLNDTERFSAQSVVIHPDNPLEIYASGAFVDKESGKTVSGKEQSLWHSADGGKTWEKYYQHVYENLPEGVSATVTAIMQLEIGPKNENGIYDIYYVADGSTYPHRVSHDGGKTFEMIYSPEDKLLEDTFYYKKGEGKYTGFYYQAYAVDMTRPGHIFFGAGGPWEYDNGTLTRKSVGFSGCAITDIAINSKGEAFFCVVDSRGAYTQTGSIYDTVNYPTMIIGTYDGGWSGTDSFVDAVFDPNDDNHVLAYVGASNSSPKMHGIRHSWDRGQSFEPMDEGAQMPNLTQSNSKFIKYDPEDSNTIYTTYITSHDNGKTWEPNEYAIIAMSNDCKRWFGTKGSGANTEYYYSTDKGKTWEFILKPGTGSMQDVLIDEGGEYVWITRSWGLYKIDLEAKKSVACNELLNCNAYNLVEQNPENPNHIVVSGQGSAPGILLLGETRDGGETWHRIPSNCYTGYTSSLTFLNGNLYYSGMSGTHIYDYKKYWEFLDSKITVMLDGKEISFTIMPEIIEGRTMVPMRELFELLGATVNWDGSTRTVTADKDRNSVKLQIDNTTVTMNGKESVMEAAPYIKNGRTMVPLRFASEALGIRVGWDDETYTIYMKSE